MSESSASDLPRSVRRAEGPGGLPVLQVRDDRFGELDVFLHGATVTHWAPPGAEGVLWLSRTSTFSTQTAIRGGIPICYPWFANGPGEDLTPAHGYARLLDWTIESVQERPEGVEIVLGLPAGAGTVTWPGPAGTGSLSATYRVLLGASLDITLGVRNDGGQPATFEAALHSYFAVSDVHAVAVEGLAGAEYVDRQGGPGRRRQAEDVIRFVGETDRMYLGSTAEVVIDDPGFRRRISVRKHGSSSTVVWNPGAERAATMADLDPWTGFVCVETANIRSDAVTLAPGESRAMTATLQVEPRR